MKKVAALIVLLGLSGWTLADGEVLVALADHLGASQGCVSLSRAEPLCPLC